MWGEKKEIITEMGKLQNIDNLVSYVFIGNIVCFNLLMKLSANDILSNIICLSKHSNKFLQRSINSKASPKCHFALQISFVRRNGYNMCRHTLTNRVRPSITSQNMSSPDLFAVLIMLVFIRVLWATGFDAIILSSLSGVI